MDFEFYQEAASGTDQFPSQNAKKDEGLMIPLLGIAGETGTLLAEFGIKGRKIQFGGRLGHGCLLWKN